MILDRSILTLRIVDPEGHVLGMILTYWLPSTGDTLEGYVWPEHGPGDPVEIRAEVTHRSWLDDGIVTVEVEPL